MLLNSVCARYRTNCAAQTYLSLYEGVLRSVASNEAILSKIVLIGKLEACKGLACLQQQTVCYR